MATLEDMPADIWQQLLIDYKLRWYSTSLSKCSIVIAFMHLPSHLLLVRKAIYNAIKSCVFPVHVKELAFCQIHRMMSYASGFTCIIIRSCSDFSHPIITYTYYWNLLNSKLTGIQFCIEVRNKKVYHIEF
jgi:hypothetical protein